jgi:RND family efflux transporter MFP subunit
MLFKKATFYVAIAGISLTAVLASRLSAQAPIQPPPIDPPTKPYSNSVAASGIIEALSENVSIGVPDAGLVTSVHIKVSDHVVKGEPLFSLDAREIEAEYAVNAANVFVAEATLQRLHDQLQRLKSVNDPRAVSQDEVRTRENDVHVAQSQLQAARALVKQSGVRLDRTIVRAPRDGTILQVNIREGEYASATPKSPAILLGDTEHLQLRADIDEQNASRLQAGQTATAYLKGDTTAPIALKFVRVEPYVVPKVSLTGASTERVDTRVLQVIYSFEKPKDRPVYVGQQVDVFIKSDSHEIAARCQTKQLATH